MSKILPLLISPAVSILCCIGQTMALEIRVTADSTRHPLRDAPLKVVDASIANLARWVSSGQRGVTDGSDPHWLLLDFDRPLEFDQLRLLSGYGNEVASALRDYTLMLTGMISGRKSHGLQETARST